ncbi:hypothetical protein GY45DRAFT_418653 [Cubamyces sp. BRFM 1775]|nr:hypothetical protein GY45DRAFT_418653 [Cubamyces sp. BRFM 1775]
MPLRQPEQNLDGGLPEMNGQVRGGRRELGELPGGARRQAEVIVSTGSMGAFWGQQPSSSMRRLHGMSSQTFPWVRLSSLWLHGGAEVVKADVADRAAHWLSHRDAMKPRARTMGATRETFGWHGGSPSRSRAFHACPSGTCRGKRRRSGSPVHGGERKTPYRLVSQRQKMKAYRPAP